MECHTREAVVHGKEYTQNKFMKFTLTNYYLP